ncbi:MAG: hypothetical protein K8R36_10510 [Planctomycetales bacterium]|nr:hypothetical protein [Planctomycetales bacterium]
MNAAFFDDTEVAAACGITPQAIKGDIPKGKQVDVAEFRRLAVSHRRMVRVDLPGAGLKGLRDEETGETYYTDAHRLMAK